MVELQPNSNIFYKAYQIDQMKQLWRFKFPGEPAALFHYTRLICTTCMDCIPVLTGCLPCAACQETHHKDVFHWLTKHNPRIWHGKMAKSAWSKVKDAAGVTVDGAWRPRVPPSQSRRARRRSPASTLQLQQSGMCPECHSAQLLLEGKHCEDCEPDTCLAIHHHFPALPI